MAYFPLRSSRSSTHRHWQPFCNWFQMYREGGRRGSRPIFLSSRTGESRIIPLTFYLLSLRKKNSTVVWIRDHMCGDLEFDSRVRNLHLYHGKIKISRKTTKMIYFILHLWTVYGAYETYIAHPTSLGSITLTKTVPCVKVWSRLLVNLHIVCSFLTNESIELAISRNIMPIG